MSSITAGTTSTTTLVHSGDTTGSLVFKTNDTGSGGTTAVTIDTSQNVGIGTTSPVTLKSATTLQVLGNIKAGNANGAGLISLGDTASNGANAGIWRGAAGAYGSTGNYLNLGGYDGITFTTGNAEIASQTERMRIDSSGNLLVGTTATTSNARLAVTTSSTSNLDYGIYAKNSGGAFLLGIDNNGGFSTGTAAGSPYNATTATAANTVVDSAGALKRSTSSLKYKTDVHDATHGLVDLLKLRSVTYKGKNDGDTIFGGLIAEEVDAAGLTEFVQYADDGTPDALAYGNMVSLCIKAIQELKAINDQQAETINALTARVVALEGK